MASWDRQTVTSVAQKYMNDVPLSMHAPHLLYFGVEVVQSFGLNALAFGDPGVTKRKVRKIIYCMVILGFEKIKMK